MEGHALPLGQGVDHLGIPAGGGDIEGHGALHPVEVVIEAGGRLHEQGSGDPAEVQRPAQRVLEEALEQADGLLGIVEVQKGGVALRDVRVVHVKSSFSAEWRQQSSSIIVCAAWKSKENQEDHGGGQPLTRIGALTSRGEVV